MTTTEQSTVDMARRGASGGRANYLEIVTAAEEFRKQGQIGRAKMARGRKTFEEGQEEFASALLGLADAGWSGGELAREFEISETHARNTVKLARLKRDAGRPQAKR